MGSTNYLAFPNIYRITVCAALVDGKALKAAIGFAAREVNFYGIFSFYIVDLGNLFDALSIFNDADFVEAATIRAFVMKRYRTAGW